MKKTNLRIPFHDFGDDSKLKAAAVKALGIDISEIEEIVIRRKSIDARKRLVVFDLSVEVYAKGEKKEKEDFTCTYLNVHDKPEIHIIGFGPAGMFAALRCLELGYKPIIFERGKKVQERRRDLRAINQDHKVDEDSNYCFGEGGAGTYSDGKLYTRSLKRGDVRKIFQSLVFHGATEQILIDSHPHIGTNKLPKIVENIRNTILEHGGEIHFETRVKDLKISSNKIKAIITKNGNEFPCEKVILATGHSARDIFELLHEKSIALDAKSFSMGVRIEHPQSIIDKIQYSCEGERPEVLPAAAYSLVQQVKERGVYSFCMCPGGFIVPAATAPGEVVVNGMSPSKRNNDFANSGIVVEINKDIDVKKYEDQGPLRCLAFQKDLEKWAFQWGGKSQVAPAQRMVDFVEGKLSDNLNPSSYQPGLRSVTLHGLLPRHIGSRLRKGFVEFGKKMNGYYTNEANIIGVESRTSSPVSIPRSENLEHPEVSGLYPCGEGGGYAGGIVSAAMDGERCIEEAIKNYK